MKRKWGDDMVAAMFQYLEYQKNYYFFALCIPLQHILELHTRCLVKKEFMSHQEKSRRDVPPVRRKAIPVSSPFQICLVCRACLALLEKNRKAKKLPIGIHSLNI